MVVTGLIADLPLNRVQALQAAAKQRLGQFDRARATDSAERSSVASRWRRSAQLSFTAARLAASTVAGAMR
jgi:hypothetical protein